MKLVLIRVTLAFLLGLALLPSAVQAEQRGWNSDKSTAYSGGDKVFANAPHKVSANLNANCRKSGWVLEVRFSGINFEKDDYVAIAPGESLVMTVDDQRFEFSQILKGRFHAPAVALTPDMVAALKAGSQVSVSYPAASGQTFVGEYTLNESSRALGSAERWCRLSTPNTEPERFLIPQETDDPELIGKIRKIYADEIADVRKLEEEEPDVSVFVYSPDASKQLVFASIFSCRYYGMDCVGSDVLVSWEDYALAQAIHTSGGLFWIDTQNVSDGWPALWMTPNRWIDKSWYVYRWAGDSYDFWKEVHP